MSFSETTAGPCGMGSVLILVLVRPAAHCLSRSVVPARVPSHRAPAGVLTPRVPAGPETCPPVTGRQSEPCLGAGAPRSGTESVDMEDRLLSFPSSSQSQRVGVRQGRRGLGGRGRRGEETCPWSSPPSGVGGGGH